MERHAVAIVGGGQAGLVMSHRLRERGVEHLVLDAEADWAASWRRRWDSLRLITPGWMNSLPGLAAGGDPDGFAGRDEIVAYLLRYADLVRPAVRFGARVARVVADRGDVRVELADGDGIHARAVVLATGPFGQAIVSPFARELDASIAQLHAIDYRRPDQVLAGRVLVVGSGNSGAGIAADLVRTHEVLWAMGDTPRMPRRLTGQGFNELMGRLGAPPMITEPIDLDREADLMWWFNRVGMYRFERGSAIGQRPAAAASDPAYLGPGPDPLANGAVRLPRITGVDKGLPMTADGSRHEVGTVVRATGMRPNPPPVAPSITDADGRIRQTWGETEAPGVYMLGLRWMQRMGSGLLFGVAEDGEHLAALVERRLTAAGG